MGEETRAGFVVEAALFGCIAVRDRSEFVQLLSTIIDDGQFQLLVHPASPLGQENRASQYDPVEERSEIPKACRWMHRETDPPEGEGFTSYNASGAAVLGYRREPHDRRPLNTLTLMESWEGTGYVRIVFGTLAIKPASKPEPWWEPGWIPAPALYYDSDDLRALPRLANQYMDDLSAVMPTLYHRCRPQFATVGTVWYPKDEPDYIRERRLDRIAWITVFGPAYVEAYGRDVLLELPGRQVEELDDGGVLYRAAQDFVRPLDEADLHEDLLRHLGNHPKLHRGHIRLALGLPA